jgi:hypothetical protein
MTLLDQNGVIIAQTLHNDSSAGRRAAGGLFEKLQQFPGASRNIELDGQPFFSACSEVPQEKPSKLRREILTLSVQCH